MNHPLPNVDETPLDDSFGLVTRPQVDELPVASLPDLYGVARSQIYNRIAKLNIEPSKRGNKAFVNAEQIQLLDCIHQLVSEQGKTLDEAFTMMSQMGLIDGSLEAATLEIQERPVSSQDRLARQSYETQDRMSGDLIEMLGMAIARAAQHQQSDPLGNLEALERAYEKGWQLSTSQLASLLGRKTLTGQTFHRYGFTFTRVGRNGAESAWAIAKPANPDMPE